MSSGSFSSKSKPVYLSFACFIGLAFLSPGFIVDGPGLWGAEIMNFVEDQAKNHIKIAISSKHG